MSIVYKKDDGVENEDVWDDTELIKMYEDCVSATYSKLGVAATTSSWNVGDRCLARYSEDDLYYPAKIVETGQKDSQTEYLVLFEGYGNSEWVSADDLVAASSDDGSQEDGNVTMDSAPDDTPVKSHSVKVTKAKKERSLRKGTSNASRTGHSSRSHPSIPSIAPPPPMVMPRLGVPDEAEALSSMLMAWYMSGYHTGYYQAIRDMNSNS